jgi:Xaa-Pro aminopeptidase
VALALDPQLWVPEQEIYYRVEDTVIVTETGIENVTIDAVRELDDIEAMIKQKGMVDHYPPLRELN